MLGNQFGDPCFSSFKIVIQNVKFCEGMKRILIAAVLGFIGAGSAIAERRVVGEISVNDVNFGSVIKSGDIFALEFTDPGEPLVYLYRSSDGQLILANDVDGVSRMLNAESKVVVDMKDYLRNNLVRIISACLMPSPSRLVNDDFIKSSKRMREYVDPKRLKAYDEEVNALEKKYSKANLIRVEEGRWQIVQFLGLQDGSVVKYSFEGAVSPFSIDSRTRSIAEKAGSFKRFVQY